MHSLHIIISSLTLKKDEHEILSVYLKIHLLIIYFMNSKNEMNIRMTKIIYVLQKIIEKFTS